MEPIMVIDLFKQGISLIVIIVSILILPGLITGLVIAIFQAATQINEQTLSFIPRLMVTFFTLMLSGPWLLQLIMEFTHRIYESIGIYVG